jgi:hypothetical protein
MKNHFRLSKSVFQISLFIVAVCLSAYNFIQNFQLMIFSLLILILVVFANLLLFIYLFVKFFIENNTDYLKSASILLINFPLSFFIIYLMELIRFEL